MKDRDIWLILANLGDLFSKAVQLAEKYREARSDQESRSIARHLSSEAAVYHQLTLKVALLTASPSPCSPSVEGADEEILSRLGTHRTSLLVKCLETMTRLLVNLFSDMSNMRRGTVSQSQPTPARERDYY